MTESQRNGASLAVSLLCYLVGMPLLTRLIAPAGTAALLLAIPLYTMAWLYGTRVGLATAVIGIAYNTAAWVILGDGARAFVPSGATYLVVLSVTECGGAALLVLLVGNMRARAEASRRDAQRSQDLLRISEAKYRTLIELAPASIFVVESGRVIFCNQHAADMARYPRDRITGVPIGAIVHEEDVSLARDILASRAAGESRPPSVFRLRTGDGTVIWAETMGQRIEWEGRPAVMYFSTDVTERRNAEEALRESEQRYRVSENKYRNLVDGAPEGVWVVEDARISFCNSHFADMLGYGMEEMRGMPVQAFNHPDDLARSMARYEARAEGKRLPKSVTRHVRKDGRVLWVETIGHRIDWEGRPAVLYFTSDVTERKAFEEQFAHAQKMEAIGRLAGGIAHDFNNLLQVILGFCSMLRSYPEDRQSVLRDLGVIEDSARRAASLTQQLLAFSRKQVVQPRVIELPALVRQSQQMLSRVLGDNIALVVEASEEESRVRSDSGQLHQVIMNLAINARDAMPEGGTITFTVDTVNLTEQAGGDIPAGEYVRLQVADTGGGMDAETLSHVFEPFFTTRASVGGTGLGLSIVYGVVQQNGGHIHARSAPGEGTTFTIHLPRVFEEDEVALAPPVEPSSPGAESILVVEDQEPVRQLVRIVLERAGFTVTEAQNGEEAVRICENSSGFDLLITDVVLPGISGDVAAEAVRRRHPRTRVIYMSGYLSEQDAARLGGVPVLEKPFSAAELLQYVKRAVAG